MAQWLADVAQQPKVTSANHAHCCHSGLSALPSSANVFTTATIKKHAMATALPLSRHILECGVGFVTPYSGNLGGLLIVRGGFQAQHL